MYYRNHLSPPQFPATWASAWGEDRYGLWMKLSYQDASLTFRWIIPGTFMMGSPDGSIKGEDEEKGRVSWEDQHEVTLAQGFWIADTPITQAFWQAVTGENPSNFKGDELPVEKVSWDDMQEFIQKLNQLHPDLSVRLPWEAEWEYACRAGTTTAFYFGDDIDLSKANYNGHWDKWGEFTEKAKEQTTPVKSYVANAWGLYDMHGNVWEWCQDEWQKQQGTEPVVLDSILLEKEKEAPDTLEKDKQEQRVLRGGSWYSFGRFCRSASRGRGTPDDRRDFVGCRLALGHLSSSPVPGTSSLVASSGRRVAGAAPDRDSDQTAAGIRKPK